MLFDPADVEPRDFYAKLVSLVVPRPIGWISTRSEGGIDNVAPYSFYNAVCAKPPVVFFSGSRDRQGHHKHSVINAMATGEFAVNVVSHTLGEAMNMTSGSVPEDQSEFDVAGLTPEPCEVIAAHRVAEAVAHLECKVVRTLDFGDGGPMSTTLVFGEIVLMHVRDEVLVDGQVDAAKLDAIGRLGGENYASTRDRFTLGRPK
jgi:flavin reductase (DIM6/NTAB) family NADH-FMN oxidoreductase RutF